MSRDKDNLRRWNRENYQKRKTDLAYMEKRRASALKYYHNHKEQYAQNQKEYMIRNQEAYRQYRREWNYTSPRGIYSIIKSALKDKNNHRKALLKISKEDFVKWYNSQEKICFYCKRTLGETQTDILNRKVHRLTIDRIDNNKGYEKGNLVLACLRCNAIKNNYFTKDEMLEIGEIIRRKEWEAGNVGRTKG